MAARVEGNYRRHTQQSHGRCFCLDRPRYKLLSGKKNPIFPFIDPEATSASRGLPRLYPTSDAVGEPSYRSARCMSTLSMKRPDLKPTRCNVPTWRKPNLRCRPTEA